MIRTIRSTSLALAIAVVTGAALSPPIASAQQPPSRTADNAPAGTASDAKVTRGDRNALRDLAQANMAEIETAKLALQKSQNAKVKHFAQMMVDDHTKGLGDVQQLAQAKGVELPGEPSIAQKAAAKGLSSLEGEEFDRQYISKAGVTDHRKVQGMLQKTGKNTKDNDVKQLTGKMLPVVERHLAEAQAMSRNGKAP